jgi:hypothetical protein
MNTGLVLGTLATATTAVGSYNIAKRALFCNNVDLDKIHIIGTNASLTQAIFLPIPTHLKASLCQTIARRYITSERYQKEKLHLFFIHGNYVFIKFKKINNNDEREPIDVAALSFVKKWSKEIELLDIIANHPH